MDNIQDKTSKFFSSYPIRTYRKNQILIYKGEAPNGVFHIVSGRVKQYDISDEGREVIVNIYKPSAFFPMQWALNKNKNQYFFETITTTILRLAPNEEVVKFLKQNPDVIYDLLKRVYSGMDGLVRRMAHLMVSRASIRILFELITEAKRFGQQQKDGSVIIPMHSYELANLSGLTRETISRELVTLKNSGLIDINRRHITIRDLKKLESTLNSHL